ncbi:MAG: metallophosphoesterase [Balneolales bacterium]
MNRKRFLRNSVAAGLGTGLVGCSPFKMLSSDDDISRLTILHTNDTHARIEPFSENAPEYAGMGGVARRATMIKRIRSENPHTLLLDAGDVFQGTPYFNEYHGALDYEVMSKMGYDASTIGNHEFDNGVQGFCDVADKANFPFLSSNYNFGSTDMGYHVREFMTKKVGDVKVGIFGLGVDFQNLVLDHLHKGISYISPVAISRKMVMVLKYYHHCDMVICLSHLGYDYADNRVSDRVLAREVDGIDLIIGGHTHTFLDQPEVFQKSNGKQTLVSQVGFAGIMLGRIDYEFNERNEVAGVMAMNEAVIGSGSQGIG